MSNCKVCSLNTKCKNPGIEGTKLGSSAKSRIMVIQDNPTFKDDRSDDAPTTDTKQKILYFLKQAGINKADVYFTSAIKCSTPKIGDIKKKHVEACRNEFLLAEIVEIKPRVIITMGKVAHQALTNHESVMEFCGHFSDFEINYPVKLPGSDTVKEATFRTKVMPTMGLNGSLMKWQWNDEIIRHFKKALHFAKTGEAPQTPAPQTNLILSKEALLEFRDRILKSEWVATDLETTGFIFYQDKIICAGYCGDNLIPDIIYRTPYEKEHLDDFDKDEQLYAVKINKFIRENKELIDSVMTEVHEKIRAVLHNGKFDSKFVAYARMPYGNFYADTLVADSLVDENLGHSLNQCYERVGLEFGPYDVALFPYVNKDEKKKKSYQWIPPTLMVKYLGYDVYGIKAKLWPWQLKKMQEQGLENHFFARKMQALKMVTKSEFIGMKANKKLLRSISAAIEKKNGEVLSNLQKLTKNEEFNPNSGKQISEYMEAKGYPCERLGIPKNATGYSTAAAELTKLLAHKKYAEFPKMILDYKKLTKIKGTYVDGKSGTGGLIQYLDPAHRIHTNFNLWTPVTSRWSANRPSVQVWPRPLNGLPNIRNCIITKDGWNLFEADYKALEQFVVAGLSRDRVLCKLLNEGVDIHSYNATSLGKELNVVESHITYTDFLDYIGKGKIAKEEFEKDAELKSKYLLFSDLRTRAKTIGFGLNYGKGAISFAEEFKISEEEAQDMIDAYFNIYKDMKKWRDHIVKQALIHGEIKLESGRTRRFHAAKAWLESEQAKSTWVATRLREEIARQAMNYPVQGGAHEIFEPACIRLTRRFKQEGMKARIGFYIHDGVLGECPKEENEMLIKCIHEEMPHILNPGTEFQLKVDVDCDIYESCWYGPKLNLKNG